MIKIFENISELAKAFCDELMKMSKSKENFCIALSGGTTPKIIFQALAEDYNSKINWNKIHLFWGDERCVLPEDDQSNYGMTKKYLLDFIDIPEKNVHRIFGENDPGSEAERYSEEIKKKVIIKNGLPNFDLVMLGLGEDGHTASIFPNQSHLLNSEKIYEVAIHPSSGQKRITITGKVINNSKRVIFLVAGKSKAKILQNVIEKREKKFPAEYIEPINGSLEFFIDFAAAELLEKKYA